MKIAVGRHINGITINDLEFIRNEDDTLMTFDNKEAAVDFLEEHDISEEEMETFTFVDASEIVEVDEG